MIGWLADAVVLLHVAFVAFVMLGGLWVNVARGRTARWVLACHVPAVAWGIWIEFSGGICPLTPLENHLRAAAGQIGYRGGFIDHDLMPLLYPVGLTPQVQWVLGSVVIAVNGLAYGAVVVRVRRQRQHQLDRRDQKPGQTI